MWNSKKVKFTKPSNDDLAGYLTKDHLSVQSSFLNWNCFSSGYINMNIQLFDKLMIQNNLNAIIATLN